MKITFQTSCKYLGPLSIVVLVGAGCGDPPGSGADDGAGVESETKSALGAVLGPFVFTHGGSAGQQTYGATMGIRITPGFHRTTARVWNIGSGDCYLSKWTSSDVRDGSVNLVVTNAGGFASGTCNVIVTENPDPPVHGLCETGPRSAPLAAISSQCVADICAIDSYCCTTSWDSVCVGEVRSVCGSLICQPAPPCAHAACSEGGALSPADCGEAVALICSHDPGCCTTGWSSTCVSDVPTYSFSNCGT